MAKHLVFLVNRYGICGLADRLKIPRRNVWYWYHGIHQMCGPADCLMYLVHRNPGLDVGDFDSKDIEGLLKKLNVTKMHFMRVLKCAPMCIWNWQSGRAKMRIATRRLMYILDKNPGMFKVLEVRNIRQTADDVYILQSVV